MVRSLLLSGVLVSSLGGCASMATWHYSDPALATFLQNRRTHCESLPRIYSGFYFDYCWLNSDPQRVYGSAPMALLILDAGISSIFDTLALPVTALQQRERGNIPLVRSSKETGD
jgi:uncharacterized protein YceK